MGWVHKAMDETNREAFNTLSAHKGNTCAHRCLIQGQQNLAGIIQAFRHRQAPAARHKRLGQFDVQIILIVTRFIRECQNIAKTFRGNQRGFRPLAFNHRIGGKRGAVDHQRQIGGSHRGLNQHLLHAFKHALLGRGRRGQDLCGPALAILFDGKIREGAANIHGEPRVIVCRCAHCPISAAQRVTTAQAAAKSSMRIASFGL